MGLKQEIEDLRNRQIFIVKSTPATYAQGATQPILTVRQGPVLIQAIVEYADTIIAAATETQVLVGALGMDFAAVVIAAAAAGMSTVSPLDVDIAKVAPTLNSPLPSILGRPASLGVVAGPGQIINVTFTVADMGAAELYSLLVMYRKLTPLAYID